MVVLYCLDCFLGLWSKPPPYRHSWGSIPLHSLVSCYYTIFISFKTLHGMEKIWHSANTTILEKIIPRVERCAMDSLKVWRRDKLNPCLRELPVIYWICFSPLTIILPKMALFNIYRFYSITFRHWRVCDLFSEHWKKEDWLELPDLINHWIVSFQCICHTYHKWPLVCLDSATWHELQSWFMGETGTRRN